MPFNFPKDRKPPFSSVFSSISFSNVGLKLSFLSRTVKAVWLVAV